MIKKVVAAAAATGGLVLAGAGLAVADSAQIFTVGTVPHARREGVARRLVEAMLDEARRREATEVFLEVRVDNEAAKALYEGFGFVPLRLPGDMDFASMFHGVDERVPVDALQFGVRVLDRLLLNY